MAIPSGKALYEDQLAHMFGGTQDGALIKTFTRTPQSIVKIWGARDTPVPQRMDAHPGTPDTRGIVDGVTLIVSYMNLPVSHQSHTYRLDQPLDSQLGVDWAHAKRFWEEVEEVVGTAVSTYNSINEASAAKANARSYVHLRERYLVLDREETATWVETAENLGVHTGRVAPLPKEIITAGSPIRAGSSVPLSPVAPASGEHSPRGRKSGHGSRRSSDATKHVSLFGMGKHT